MLFLAMVSCKNSNKKKSSNAQTDSISQQDDQPKKLQNPYRVIPGKQMGNFVLNEDADSILDSLPEPDYSDAAMGKVLLKWKNVAGDSFFMFNSQKMGVEDFKRIKTIRSLSSKFRTDHDLGVNSKLSALKGEFDLDKTGTFKKNNQTFTLFTSQKGIGFEIDENNFCKGIVIFTEDYSPEKIYVPFYSAFHSIKN